jgi:hypothetical protein
VPALKSDRVVGTIRLPSPHAGQRIVFGGAKRFNWGSMGRRWRKTSGVMAHVAIPAALRGKRVIWAAPTHKQTMIGWDEAQKALGASGAARFNRTEMTAYFDKTGGRIMFFSMDEPDNARGHTADVVVIDEAGDVPEVAWFEVLRPMLLDTRGEAWVIGTPKGRNWFWRGWMAARDRADSTAWWAPALGVRIDPVTNELVRDPHPLENPDIDFGEMADLWSETPERSFRQEYLAEFLDDGGGVFRGVEECATGELKTPYKGNFGIGGDLARVNDFTVLTVIDIDTKAVVDWARFNNVDWYTQQLRISALYARWSSVPGSTCQIVIERNMAGDPVIEALRRVKLPVVGFQTTAKSKGPLIQDLVLAIERRQITYPNIPVVVGELQAYEQERLVSGVIRYRAPEGLHDDCVISLALAWKLAKRGNQGSKSNDFRFVVKTAAKHGSSLIADYRRALRVARKVING